MSTPSAAPRFDGQPFLQGRQLDLRPMVPQDWEPLFAVAADPLIWALHPSSDRHNEPVFRKYFDDGLSCKGALVVIDREQGRIVGASRYSFVFADPGEVEIGWTFLARPYWGGAANREIKRLMLRHAFRFVDTVMFRVGADNWRSRRAMEKIGGKLTQRTHTSTINGREIPHVVYVIGAADFAVSALAGDLD